MKPGEFRQFGHFGLSDERIKERILRDIEPVVDRGPVIHFGVVSSDGVMTTGYVRLAKDDPRRYGR
jgi:hypothetical protein